MKEKSKCKYNKQMLYQLTWHYEVQLLCWHIFYDVLTCSLNNIIHFSYEWSINKSAG
jgi:hypothetical protein